MSGWKSTLKTLFNNIFNDIKFQYDINNKLVLSLSDYKGQSKISKHAATNEYSYTSWYPFFSYRITNYLFRRGSSETWICMKPEWIISTVIGEWGPICRSSDSTMKWHMQSSRLNITSTIQARVKSKYEISWIWKARIDYLNI